MKNPHVEISPAKHPMITDHKDPWAFPVLQPDMALPRHTMMRPLFFACVAMMLLVLGAYPTTAPANSELPQAWSSSSSEPIAPVYHISDDNSVALQICFNWSCAERRVVHFTSREMAQVHEKMAVCSGPTLHDRVQRLRLGVWQMELLAESKVPVLANDAAINLHESGLNGRTDCIDNTTNTHTYLEILIAQGVLPGWSIAAPEVRDIFEMTSVHWTAVVSDEFGGGTWSVDSWYRPNGHLPFVMPLQQWRAAKVGWLPPLDRFNPYPVYSEALCARDNGTSAGLPSPLTDKGS